MKFVLAVLGAIPFLATPALAAPAYTAAGSVALGAPDRWDYVVADGATGRVYVAHADRLTVVDGRRGVVVGSVEGIAGGTHGTGVSLATGQGFTDDGKVGEAVAFDLKTLRVTRHIAADKDADGIATDAGTGRVFVIEGDPGAITVIDPKTDAVVGTIKTGEKMEYAAGDGRGSIYVAGEEKRTLLRINARTLAITGRWSAPDCQDLHGLAVDPAGRRVFMGCVNAVMAVLDADTGRVIASLPIGRGNDAMAFDPVRKRVFSSSGRDGTVSVYQQRSPDHYEALETLTTQVSGRTMDVDPVTGRLFVAAAELEPAAAPGGRPRAKPGTLKLLMFDPLKATQ